MSLQLFNSLTRTKEIFKPINKNKVSMYVCGITPNNATHLGHAFTYVFFDALIRYLLYKGFKVDYLQNATDINDSDDVIIQAKKAGRTWEEEASFWIDHFHKQMDTLNVLRPSNYVLATSVIDKIIEINTKLIKKGHAYEKNGNVYFSVEKFPNYSKLSRFSSEQMLFISRERGNNIKDPNKRNPLDFVLWFHDSKKPNWNSPWGPGRPGWHIECTAMIHQYLGEQIDIHGGGRDLIFPHHESEIAQSETLTGKRFVNSWMHVAMVLYEGEKMSKSLGNLVLVEDLLKKYSPNAIRWLLLSHHYRAPWEFEEYELEATEKKITAIKKSLQHVKKGKSIKAFEVLMDDDFQTPKVLELIEKLVLDKKNEEAKSILQTLGFLL